MHIGGLKKILARSAEGIFAVLLVLVFALMLMYVLNVLFPSGTSLRAIITGQGPLASTGVSAQKNRELRILTGEQESDLGPKRTVAAVLSRTRKTVKSKRAAGLAWEKAEEGKVLYDRDAVQTLSGSAAIIEFGEDTTLDMGQNSLVIIKRLTKDPLFREKRSFVVLVDGELRGKMGNDQQESTYLEIDMPGAKVHTAKGDPIDFKVSVNPDKSSTIAVYHGSAEVMARGERVIVQANQSTEVAPNQAPEAPRALPDPVKLKSPSDSSLYYYRDTLPEIQFAWQGRPDVTNYHFVLARDPSFRDTVVDDRFLKTRFTARNLKSGTYFWKVSVIEKTREGLFGQTRQFRVVQDHEPPVLQVRFPPATVYSETCTLHGKAEPGARVFVGGKRVRTTRAGKFQYDLKLQPGINTIVVEAIDTVNNVAHRSKRVDRKG
jgi:hypothetical protein